LPNVLVAQGLYLGDRDDFMGWIALARGLFGILILVAIAYVYPGYTNSLNAEDLGSVPAAVNTAAKITSSLYDSTFKAIIYSAVCVLGFEVLLAGFTRSDARRATLRGLCRPPVAILQYTGVIVAVAETANWLSLLADWTDRPTSHGVLALPGLHIVIGLVIGLPSAVIDLFMAFLLELVVFPNVACGWDLVRVIVVSACMKTGPPV
jgi:hypothetical protein